MVLGNACNDFIFYFLCFFVCSPLLSFLSFLSSFFFFLGFSEMDSRLVFDLISSKQMEYEKPKQNGTRTILVQSVRY